MQENITPENAPSDFDSTSSGTGNTNSKTSISFIRKHPTVFTILVALLVLAVVYFWKDRQGEQKKLAMEKMATAQLVQNNQEMLKLMSKPLVWCIRSEMMRGNLEQVNLFTNDLVKENNFQFIHIVDPSGIIIVSTDKKQEGKSAGSMFDQALLNTDSVFIQNKENEMLTLAAPIMGYDKKLGLILLNYTPVKFNAGTQKTTNNILPDKKQ